MKVNEKVKSWKERAELYLQHGGPFSIAITKGNVRITNEYGSVVFCTCDRCVGRERLKPLTFQEKQDLYVWINKLGYNVYCY